MRQVGAHLGSVVHVTVSSPSGGRRTLPFQVVSQVSFPVLGGVVGLGTGAVLTIAGYEDAMCPPSPKQATCRQAALEETGGGGLLVSVMPGPRGLAAIRHYLDTYQSITALPSAPVSLVNFGEAVNFPLIFGAMLALFGAATLVHLLVVSVSRRRRETGLLKALGFVKGQIASAVAWQATTLALIGIVIGVPVGIVAGRLVWRAFATNLGVVPVPSCRSGWSWDWSAVSSSWQTSSPSHRRWRQHEPIRHNYCGRRSTGSPRIYRPREPLRVAQVQMCREILRSQAGRRDWLTPLGG